MAHVLVIVGSVSDKPFLHLGLQYLDAQRIDRNYITSSTHREPEKTGMRIRRELQDKGLRAVIAGAATATGLPGVVAGYLRDTNIPIFGVRFIKEPGPNIIEDATFNLSSMPSGVPLAYTGFNEKGFLHACMLAARIVRP